MSCIFLLWIEPFLVPYTLLHHMSYTWWFPFTQCLWPSHSLPPFAFASSLSMSVEHVMFLCTIDLYTFFQLLHASLHHHYTWKSSTLCYFLNYQMRSNVFNIHPNVPFFNFVIYLEWWSSIRWFSQICVQKDMDVKELIIWLYY